MSEKKNMRDEVRREAREALEAMRKDLQQLSKDLVLASKTLKTSTEKFVQDTGPKVSAGLEDTVETFRRTMTTIELKMNFMRPHIKGRLVAEGTIAKRGRRIAFTEAVLTNVKKEILAKCNGTWLIMPA